MRGSPALIRSVLKLCTERTDTPHAPGRRCLIRPGRLDVPPSGGAPGGSVEWGSSGRAQRCSHPRMESNLPDQISRRDLLIRGGAVAVAVGAVVYPGMARAGRDPAVGIAYQLRATDQCCCVACRGHAANKLFATREAAEHSRAHPGCRCTVVRSAPLGKERWVELFGSASELRRTAADRRWPSSRRALQGARASQGYQS